MGRSQAHEEREGKIRRWEFLRGVCVCVGGVVSWGNRIVSGEDTVTMVQGHFASGTPTLEAGQPGPPPTTSVTPASPL